MPGTFLRFPGGSDGNESACNAGHPALQSLGQEDLQQKGKATYSGILSWRIPWTDSLVGYSPWGCKESDTTERLTLSHFHTFTYLVFTKRGWELVGVLAEA